MTLNLLIQMIELVAYLLNKMRTEEGSSYSPELERSFQRLFMAVVNYNGKKPVLLTRD